MTTFRLGRLWATPGALAALTADDLLPLIRRDSTGDLGDLCLEDLAANERALIEGTRIPTCYCRDGEKVWIVTEADQSATTVLVPEEY